MLISVNYHYVGSSAYPYEGVHSIEIEKFLDHVKWLKQHFQLVSANEVIKKIQNNEMFKRNSCLITFDDGLKCHYEIVFKLMKEYNFPVHFFISSQPLKEKKAIEVHKSQYVRANTSPEYFSENLFKVAKEEEVDTNFSDSLAKDHYKYDSTEIARGKYLLNYIMPTHLKQKVINNRFDNLIDNESQFCKNWYLNEDEIIEMHETFNCIGSHAVTHQPLATLNDKESYQELESSKLFLESIIKDKINSISYPLGNINAVSMREGDYAHKIGYKLGLSMERAYNENLSNNLLLARLDANDIPTGKKPIFSINNGNIKKLPKASRYSNEKPKEASL